MVSLNSFTPKSDQSLNSPYNITPESHIKVTKIKEMVTVAEYIWTKISNGYIAFCNLIMQSIIAKLAGRSPIIIQNSSNHQAEKNLDVRPYKVLLLTCVVNCTAGMPTPRLCSVVQWSVHWAPSRTTRVLVLAGARRCALETCGKKMRAPLLGLAKSIYYILNY